MIHFLYTICTSIEVNRKHLCQPGHNSCSQPAFTFIPILNKKIPQAALKIRIMFRTSPELFDRIQIMYRTSPDLFDRIQIIM